MKRRPSWQQRLQRLVLMAAALAVASVLGALMLVNLSVAFFGSTPVNPLSPFFLEEKVHALKMYARHRVTCLFNASHDEIPDVIRAVAAKRHVDPLLLAALVETESSNRAHRISWTGAMGPAQLMPATALLLHVDDPFDPLQGIDGGARYLRMMLDRFQGRVDLALAAYNTGPGNIVGGRVPASRDVEQYVARVTTRWRELKGGNPR